MLTPRFLRRSFIASACIAALPALGQQGGTAVGPAVGADSLSVIEVRDRADAAALPPAAPGGKTATGTQLGVLGNADAMSAPFNVVGFTNEVIRDLNASTVGDVLLSDPSVQYSTNGGHMTENFLVRGLGVTSTDLAYNGAYGIVPAQHVPVEMLERVELLKGPSLLLSGMPPTGSVGGLINLVAKRAGARPIAEVTGLYSSGSYGQAHVDVGQRFGPEGRLGLRVNGVLGRGQTGVEDQRKGRELLSLGLDYQGGDGWSGTLDLFRNRDTIRNGSPGMYSMATVRTILRPPESDSNMFRGTHGEAEALGVLARVEKRFSPTSSAYVSVGGSNNDTDGLLFGTRVIVRNTAGAADGFVYNLRERAHVRTAEVGGKAEFTTGTVRHEVTAALSSLAYDYWIANRAATGWTQNIYNPVVPPFPASPETSARSREDVYSGLTLVDTLHLASDRVQLSLGLRHQRVNQKVSHNDASTTKPVVAVVVKPWGEQVSFYGNYIQGLSPGSTVSVGNTNAGQAFAPYEAKQAEIGAKLRSGGLTHTLAAFRIERDATYSLTVAPNRLPTVFNDARQRNQGLEYNVAGEVSPYFSVLAGFAHTKSTYEHTTAALTGHGYAGVPRNAASLGGEWRTPIAGLALNARYVHTGSQWLNSANTLRLPSWRRLDLGARYATRVGNHPLTLRASIDNALDKNYWAGVFTDGFATLSAPRVVRVSATVAF